MTLDELVNQILPVTMIEAGCVKRLAVKRKLQEEAKRLILAWRGGQNAELIASLADFTWEKQPDGAMLGTPKPKDK